MSRHRRWTAAALVAVALSLFLVRPTTGQPAAAFHGQYQMQVVTTDRGPAVFVCDTHTGRCWYRNTAEGAEWKDLGSPDIKAKKGP